MSSVYRDYYKRYSGILILFSYTSFKRGLKSFEHLKNGLRVVVVLFSGITIDQNINSIDVLSSK
jgi:hypothetical protein